MIYYFSGTGNSLYVARQLADALGEQLCPIAPLLFTRGGGRLSDANLPSIEGGGGGGSVGLVFPVHAWGIPNVVEQFVRNLSHSPKGGAGRGLYLYTVMTCGDDMGYADEILEKALGRKLDAAFSVQMPNTYVCLPGFDVDSDEACKEKYVQEEIAVKEIAACVSERRRVRRLKRGTFPWTKTYIIRPLFNRYLLTDKYFNVDALRCVSCGRCRKSCPVGNIILASPQPSPKGKGLKSLPLGGDLEEAIPHWQSHCAGCLACYHACPYHAINFGRMTQKKGQYNLLRQLGG